ncbi:MAG: hypothetical protein F6J87_23105 [Spirulina sp. SIO3F2]|nr:hypothetical protein [Spirulina sp. SIO3F2]
MNIKKYLIILASTWGLLWLSSFVGNALEAADILTPEKIGTTGLKVMLAVYLGLFWVIVFSAIPVALHFFVRAQIKIGNGELPAVQFLQTHFRRIVYCLWGFFGVGAIALSPIAISEWAKSI